MKNHNYLCFQTKADWRVMEGTMQTITEKYYKIIIALIAALFIACFVKVTMNTALAAVGNNTASSSRTVKSWVGIPVYTVGVKGDYYFNGQSLSKWSNARPANSTHYPGWSIKSQKANWQFTGAKSSTVRSYNTFFYGLNTQWVKIGIQTQYEEQAVTVIVK